MADKKIFEIRINGVSESLDEVINLRNALDQLQDTQSNVSRSLTDFTTETERQSEATSNSQSSIKGMKEKLEELQKAYEKLDAGARNLRSGREMAIEIQRLTEKIEELEAAADSSLLRIGSLGNIFISLNTSLESVGKVTSNFQDLLSGTEEVVESLGLKSESFTNALQKMQEVMTVVNKVQALSTTLMAQDSIVMKGLTLVRNIYNASLASSTKLMGLLKVAMATTGIGLVVIAVAALVANFDKLKERLANALGGMEKLNGIMDALSPILEKVGEALIDYIMIPIETLIGIVNSVVKLFEGDFKGAIDSLGDSMVNFLKILVPGLPLLLKLKNGGDAASESMDKLSDKTQKVEGVLEKATESAADTMLSFYSLQQQWNDLGNDLDAKKRFITENSDAFRKMGVEVKGVEDAENMLVKNSRLFVNAMKNRALATAHMQVAMEKYKEVVRKQINGEDFSEEKKQAESLMQISRIYADNAEIMQGMSGVKKVDENTKNKKNKIKPNRDTKDEKNRESEEALKAAQDYMKQEEEADRKFKKEQNQRDIEASEKRIKTLLDEKKRIGSMIEADQSALKKQQEEELKQYDVNFKTKQELLIQQQKVEVKEAEDKYIKLKESLIQYNKDTSELDASRKRESENKEKEHQQAIEDLNIEYKAKRLKIKGQMDNQLLENLKQGMAEEKKLLEEHYKAIETKAKGAVSKKDNGVINVEATKKNFAEVIAAITSYQIELDNAHSKELEFYEEQYKLAEGNEVKRRELQALKEQSIQNFVKTYETSQKKLAEVSKGENTIFADMVASLGNLIKDKWDKYKEYVTQVSDSISAILGSQLESLKEQLTETTKAYDSVVEKHKESQDKMKSLEEEAKNASGGRALVVQEQIAHQMEANAELARQEQDLAKQKEKLEKDVAKKERQQKKVKSAQQMIEAGVNISLGIAKAWGQGGAIMGPVLAAIVAAAGAIQIAIMAKNIAKLEDGGLLRGKRHSQGGMRIEGTNIEVEGDEYVVNRVSTRKNLGLIEYINRSRKELSAQDVDSYFDRSGRGYASMLVSSSRMYEEGGALTNLAVVDSVTPSSNERMLEAISNINIRPVVSVVDIASVQNRVVDIQDIAGV